MDRKGYPTVKLSKKGKKKHFSIHRLVAEAFVPNEHNKLCVDHIDNNRRNNDYWNLRWVTNMENQYNKGIQKNNSTGIKGIQELDGRYRVTITVNHVRLSLGTYDTIEEATIVRKLKAKELQGEFMHECEKITDEERLYFQMKKMEI